MLPVTPPTHPTLTSKGLASFDVLTSGRIGDQVSTLYFGALKHLTFDEFCKRGSNVYMCTYKNDKDQITVLAIPSYQQ